MNTLPSHIKEAIEKEAATQAVKKSQTIIQKSRRDGHEDGYENGFLAGAEHLYKRLWSPAGSWIKAKDRPPSREYFGPVRWNYETENDSWEYDGTNIHGIKDLLESYDDVEWLDSESLPSNPAVEALEKRNHELMAENDTMSNELGELREINQFVERRIIQSQQDLMTAYRNRITMTPGISIETILAMLEDDIKTLRTMNGGNIINSIKTNHDS